MRLIHKSCRSPRRVACVATAAALALGGVLAGCDDGNDSESGDEAAAVDSTGAESAVSATSSAADGSNGSSDPQESDESDGSADSEGSGDVDEFCDSLEQIDELDPNVDGEQVVEEFKRLDENAPPEVSGATGLLVRIVELSVSAFELEGDEQQEVLAELAASEDDFNQAAADFETFAMEACPDLPDEMFGSSPTTDA